MSKQILKTINFGTDQLSTIKINGIPHVALKPICKAIGIAWDSQFRRIQRNEALNSVVAVMATTAQDGKKYETITLPLDVLNGWLFGISTNRIKNPQTRDKIIAYQKQCYKVLYEYWHQGSAKAEKIPQLPCTKEERAPLNSLVGYLVNNSGLEYEMAWMFVNGGMGVRSSKLLTAEQIPDAMKVTQKLMQKYVHVGKVYTKDETCDIKDEPTPVYTTITSGQLTDLKLKINAKMALLAFNGKNYIYDVIRKQYNIREIKDLPAKFVGEVMDWVESLEREYILPFKSFVREWNTTFFKQVICQGVPMTSKLKRDWEKKFGEEVGKNPDWIGIYQELNAT